MTITPDLLALAPCREPAAVVLDGVVLAVLPAQGRLDWVLPHDLFGRLLDIEDTRSGSSLLSGPVSFETYRRVRWDGWSLHGRRVCGAFALEGPAAAPGLPIAIALEAAGQRVGQGFAHHDGGSYRFELMLDRLPADGAGLTLRPRVGNLTLETALDVPADAFEHVGYLDRMTPWGAGGWVANRRSAAPVRVGLWVDGRRVATALADKHREDVQAAGIGDGRAGFQILYPAKVRLDRPMLVDVRILPDGPGLAGGPHRQAAQPRFIGHFDGIVGFYAGGWVLEVAALDQPVRVEAVCDGAVIGTALADLQRADVAAAGLPRARCGFHFPLTGSTADLLGRTISVRVAGVGTELPGGPAKVIASPAVAAFLGRRRAIGPALEARLRRALTRRTRGLRVSIVMPVFETPRAWLIEAIESVRAQWSDGWELICVDDGSRAPHVAEVLAAYARADRRIRVLRSPVNGGIARAVNYGLRAASGDYVGFLDHDDALEPDAVYRLARAAQETGAGLIYSDEVTTGPSLDQLHGLQARPAFSHDYYLSHPYFVHFVGVRTELARALGGYDETMRISADVDFVLRAIERAGQVAHIPHVLYRWRTHPGSTGHARAGEVMAATEAALARHLARLGRGATVQPADGFNQFRIDWPDDDGEVVIVIPTRDRADLLRTCIESVERTSAGERFRIVVIDHQSREPATRDYLASCAGRYTVMPYRGRFNYARMNNVAVRRYAGDAPYLLFLNNDVEATQPGWLARLRSLVARPEIGAAGPLLLYGDGRVQHAGVLVGYGTGANHAMRFVDPYGSDGARNPGHLDNLVSVRDYSAVTGACMMIRRDAFERVGGFDEAFAVAYNDTDLCLRLREAGYGVLYDGHSVLTHHESATRTSYQALAHPPGVDEQLRARWPSYFNPGDPFYSPLLSASDPDHHVRADVVRHPVPPRVVPSLRPAPAWHCGKAR